MADPWDDEPIAGPSFMDRIHNALDDDDFPMRQDELDLRAKPAVKQQDEWGGMDVDMDMD